jgi:predicted alpha/beta hydrolase
MGVARFKVFPGHSAADQAAYLAGGYAMEYYSFEEIDEETDRFGVTAKVYELRGLKRSECEALTQNQHVCDLAEALAAGDMTTATAIWRKLENN